MEFLTNNLLSGLLYDGFKKGITITTQFLEKKLKGWLVDDVLLEELAVKINALELEDYSEKIIEQKLNESLDLQEILKMIKPEHKTSICSAEQTHSGSGDNIIGNKTIYNN